MQLAFDKSGQDDISMVILQESNRYDINLEELWIQSIGKSLLFNSAKGTLYDEGKSRKDSIKIRITKKTNAALASYCDKHNKIMTKEADRFIREGIEREFKKK